MLSIAAIVASALIGAVSSAFPFALIVLASAAALGLSCASGALAGEPAEALMRSGLSTLLLVEVGYMLGASIQIFWHARSERSARYGEPNEATGFLRLDYDAGPPLDGDSQRAPSSLAALSAPSTPPLRP